MSITDELREYTEKQIKWLDVSKVHYRKLFSIADRIDAQHEAKVSYWQGASYKDGYDDGFASADDWLAQHEDAMAEHGWIRLPKDADGVPIHIGDVMEWRDSGDTLEVIGIGDNTLFYVDPEGDRTYAEWTAARNKRHHHAPTVEDVLREFAYGLGVPVADSYVAAAAAKLRLAEGEDA